MKRNLIKISSFFMLLMFLTSCGPFHEERIVNYKKEIEDLVYSLKGYEQGSYDRDSMDEFDIKDIRYLGIDRIVINKASLNKSFSGFVEENDSLIILISRADHMFDREKRIIYDFKTSPRMFGSEVIKGASYKVSQINDRLYYAESSFD